MGEEIHPSRRSITTFSSHTRTADLHTEQKHETWSVHVCTEIVRSETFLYASLCTANVTFITDQ